jgi:hypothetical protein
LQLRPPPINQPVQCCYYGGIYGNVFCAIDFTGKHGKFVIISQQICQSVGPLQYFFCSLIPVILGDM